MKHSLLLLVTLFITIHAYGAVIDTAKPVTSSASLSSDCDTMLLTSGILLEVEIVEEKADDFKVRLCQQNRLVMVKKNNIAEIRTASGAIRKIQEEQLASQEQLEEAFDPEKKRKRIRKGILLILLALALVLPFGYLGFAFAFGGANFLAILSILVPISVFVWGIAELSKGISMRKPKKKEKG